MLPGSFTFHAVLSPFHPCTIKILSTIFSSLTSFKREKIPGPFLLFRTASERKLGRPGNEAMHEVTTQRSGIGIGRFSHMSDTTILKIVHG